MEGADEINCGRANYKMGKDKYYNPKQKKMQEENQLNSTFFTHHFKLNTTETATHIENHWEHTARAPGEILEASP